MANYTPMQEKILQLKKEKNALVLAHYYVPLDVQEVADFVCDSFEMAKRAKAAEQQLIVICGVRFMGESAKLLSPGKKVLLPAMDAGCPMADMVTPEDIKRLREEHPGAAVMCYVNSSAAVKAVCDICCTSSSALRIANSLDAEEIIFVPDRNLGSYIAENVPEKKFILHCGHCPVHNDVTAADIKSAKTAHPSALLAAHPECRQEVLDYADFIGSTSEIITFCQESDEQEFLIATESAIVDILRQGLPEKKFYSVTSSFICSDMKKCSLEALLACLEKEQYEVVLTEDEITAARESLDKMVKA